SRYGIVSGAETAGEPPRHLQFRAWARGSEHELLELGVCSVDVEADAGPDHDADDGIVHPFRKPSRYPDRHHLTAAKNDGGAPILTDQLDLFEDRSSVAIAHRGADPRQDVRARVAQRLRHVTAVLREHLRRIAARDEDAVAKPPDFVRAAFEQGFVV